MKYYQVIIDTKQTKTFKEVTGDEDSVIKELEGSSGGNFWKVVELDASDTNSAIEQAKASEFFDEEAGDTIREVYDITKAQIEVNMKKAIDMDRQLAEEKYGINNTEPR